MSFRPSYLRQSFLFLIGICMISGCAMHQGYMVNSAALSSNNFSYVKRGITGTAIATYVFGLGGNAKNALVDEAKANMLSGYAEHPLSDNRALVNLTVNWKLTYVLPFAISNRCTVTADIVEFK